MRKLITLTLVLCIAFAVSSQDNSESNGFDYGTVENDVYTNSFFEFQLTLPAEWIVQSKEQTNNMVEMGKDMIAGDDANLKAVIKASEINSAYLLTLFQHEVGTAVEYNPSLMIIAENLKLTPGIKTGSDYLFQTRRLLKQSQMDYDHIDEEFAVEELDGQDFHKMNVAISYLDLKIKQSYISTVQNGFALSVIISYVTEEQKNELEGVLHSIQFD